MVENWFMIFLKQFHFLINSIFFQTVNNNNNNNKGKMFYYCTGQLDGIIKK